MRMRWNMALALVGGLALLGGAATAPAPVAAATGGQGAVLRQYPGYYGSPYAGYAGWYGGIAVPWVGIHYSDSGLSAWDGYNWPYASGVRYFGPTVTSYYSDSAPYGYPADYGFTRVIPPVGGQYTTPNGTSFVVCPWYASYC